MAKLLSRYMNYRVKDISLSSEGKKKNRLGRITYACACFNEK